MEKYMQPINPVGLMKSPAFSQAIVTRGNGDTLYIGGQNAVNEKGETIGKDDLIVQTEQVMQNIKTILEAAGVGFKDVVKMNIYLVQGQDAKVAYGASQKFFEPGAPPPAITVLFVAGLGNPEFLLEVDAVAYMAGE